MGFRLVWGMISSSPPVRVNSSHRKFNGYSAIPGEQRRGIFLSYWKGKEIWFGRVRLWIFPRVLEMKIEEKIGRGMLLVFLVVWILMDYFTIFGNYVRFSINFHNGLRLNLKINLRVFEGTFFPSSEENFANFSYSLFRIRWRKTRGGMRGIGWIKGKLEAEERERRGVKRRTLPIARNRNLRSRHTASAR